METQWRWQWYDDVDNDDDNDDVDNDDDDVDDGDDDDENVRDRRGDVGQHDPDTSRPAISVVRLPRSSLLFPSLPFLDILELEGL